MTDVYLRTGYASPNDVVLYDPTASPITYISVGQITETDVSWAIAKQKIVHVGQATETDSAQSITKKTGITVVVSQATETDSAFGLVAVKTKSCGQASEMDSVFQFDSQKTKSVGMCADAETSRRLMLRRKYADIVAKNPIRFDAEIADFVVEKSRDVVPDDVPDLQIESLRDLVVEQEVTQFEG
jgi:hypothetical protein